MGLKSLFKGRKKNQADPTCTSKSGGKSAKSSSAKVSGDDEGKTKKSPNIVSSSKVNANSTTTAGGDADGGVIIPATSTESTGTYSSLDGSAYSQLELSQLAHGSNVDIGDMAKKSSNNNNSNAAARANGGGGGGLDMNLSVSNGALPDVIATLKKQRPMAAQQQQQQHSMHPASAGWNGNGGIGGNRARIAYRGDDETLNEDMNTTNYQRGAVGIGDQLSVVDILNIGLSSVLGCVTQCKPMGGGGPNASSAAPPVPGLIDPFANDDKTVGSLTLMTVEREERQRTQMAATMCGATTPDRYQPDTCTRMKAIAPQQVVDNFSVDKQERNKDEGGGKKAARKRAVKHDGDESDSDCDSIFGTIGCHFVTKPASRKG